jgi:type I restriction enzyme S subunit
LISEILNNIPKTWELTDLENICVVNPKLDKTKFEDELTLSFVPMSAVGAGSGSIDVTEEKLFHQVKKGYTPFIKDDVLFAKITPCMENGKSAIVPELIGDIGFGSTEFHVFRSHRGFSEKFLYYFVSSKLFRVEAEHNMTGAVGQRRVPAPWLSAFKIPVPPSSEQIRIVEKIEELFSELDKGIESLKTAKAQLSVYRQALLKHAFEGKLTEQWRASNADKLESPEQLLARIQQGRESRYEQQIEDWKKEVEKWEADGKEGKKPSKPKKSKKLDMPSIDSSNFSELPDNWGWVRIGELNVDVFDGPFGSNLKTSDYVDQGIRVIRLENIGAGYFVDDKCSYITESKYELLKKHHVSHGDIVFSSFVIDKTRVSLIPQHIDKAINKADCFCIRNFGETINSEFMLRHLSSIHVFKQIEELVHGVGRPRINTTQLKNIWMPLCSKEEQYEIIQRVNEQMTLVDHFEKDIEENLGKSEVLRLSILKKAFSGRLVSQDPNDEPASELLKKITIEKSELAEKEKAEKAAVRKAKASAKKSKA